MTFHIRVLPECENVILLSKWKFRSDNIIHELLLDKNDEDKKSKPLTTTRGAVLLRRPVL
jgi:hypothetical protein